MLKDFRYMLADMEMFQNLVNSLNGLSKLKTVVVVVKGGKPIMKDKYEGFYVVGLKN